VLCSSQYFESWWGYLDEVGMGGGEGCTYVFELGSEDGTSGFVYFFFDSLDSTAAGNATCGHVSVASLLELAEAQDSAGK
jgi:hypothetical protein